MFFRVPSARFKYVKYITEPWQFEIDPLHLGGIGTPVLDFRRRSIVYNAEGL